MAKFIAQSHPITEESGVTLEQILRFRDGNGNIVDITGYTARMEVRAEKGEDPDLVDPILVLTTENGGITIDETLGKLSITIETTDVSQTGYYDLLLISPEGKKYKPIKSSKLNIKPSITSLPE